MRHRLWARRREGAMDEQPTYSEISELEMRDLEAEFGHPLTRELAFWLIRNKIIRDAVQLMIDEIDGTPRPEEPPGTTHKRAA
jgi:hypothetical protein